MPTPTYDLIESVTLTTSASSVTFSSITQDYRDLVLVTDAITEPAPRGLEVNFNSDFGLNYPYVYMRGNGSVTQSNAGTDDYIFGGFPKSVGAGFAPNVAVHQIMDYSATDKHTSVLTRQGNTSERVYAQASRWANTSAVTSVTITCPEVDPGDSFAAGSTFNLYGIAS